MQELINTLQFYLGTKAPQLPIAIKAFIVKILPYIVIVIMLFRVALIMALTTPVSEDNKGPYWPVPRSSALWAALCGLGLAASVFFLLMALPGLFYPEPDGWQYLFYAELISILSMVMMMDLAGFLVGGLLVMLVLFQIRPYYFGVPPPPAAPIHVLVPAVTPGHAITVPGLTLKATTLR